MANIGYARVSTTQQDLSIQLEALRQRGIKEDHLFYEKVSGKNIENRPQLKRLLDFVRKGDVIHVSKMDRLGRNSRDLINILHELEEQGVHVEFFEEGLSNKGPIGKMLLTIISAVAEMDRTRILERTAQGRKAAKKKGVTFGRKPVLDDKQIAKLRKEAATSTLGAAELGRKYGISRATVYRLLGD